MLKDLPCSGVPLIKEEYVMKKYLLAFAVLAALSGAIGYAVTTATPAAACGTSGC